MFVSTETMAQGSRPELGLRLGGNLAQLRGSDNALGNDATDRKLGFIAGAFAEMPLSGSFSVQPELLYAQKGGRIDESFVEDDLDGDFRSDFKLNYLELPVLVKYSVPTGSRIRPSVYAGPYAAYSVKRSIDIDVEGDEGDLGLSLDADDTFKRLDYGAVFGVDFGYRLARRAATIGVRYDLGLANVFKDDASFSDGEDDIDLGEPEARAHELSVVLGVTLF